MPAPSKSQLDNQVACQVKHPLSDDKCLTGVMQPVQTSFELNRKAYTTKWPSNLACYLAMC
jgi:hypothetical protein